MEPKTQKVKVTQGTARLKVAELLADRGWNMLEFSRRSGLSYPTVLALVKSTYRGPVSLDTALALAMAFGVSLDELIVAA